MAEILFMKPFVRKDGFRSEASDVSMSTFFFKDTPFAHTPLKPPDPRTLVENLRTIASKYQSLMNLVINETLVDLQRALIDAVVFEDMHVREDEPGIGVYRRELAGISFDELGRIIGCSAEDAWRKTPALYGALSLVYRERKGNAVLALPPNLS